MRGASPFFAAAYRLMVLCLAFAAPSAWAAESSALALFEKGEYAKAIDTAAAEGGGVGFALAARATLAEASLRDAACLECLKRAEGYARQAIAADPDNLEGQLQLAVALGFEARIIGPLRARFQRFPEQARNAIEIALRLEPDNPWALATAGGFQIEVVRSGGRLLANLFYGASFDDGVAYYQRAMGADPGNAVIKLQYALALTGFAFDARRAEIVTVLDSAARVSAPDAYGKAMKIRAAKLLDLLNRNKREEYLALASRYFGFPQAR